MTAKLICVTVCVLGAAVGSCLPVASEDENAASVQQATAAASSPASTADVPLEIVISQFPGGYQGRWATTAAGCVDDPEIVANAMALQGQLIKLPNSVGTMLAGKRLTSRTMEAEFEFAQDERRWTQSIGFELSNDRKQIIRIDRNDGQRYPYVLCPKLMAG